MDRWPLRFLTKRCDGGTERSARPEGMAMSVTPDLSDVIPDDRVPWRGADTVLTGVCRWTLQLASGFLPAAGALLVWRRLAGGVAIPLPTAWLLTVALGLAVVTVIARLAWRQWSELRKERSAGVRWLPNLIFTTSILAWGIALSLPGVGLGGLTALWSFLLLEEAWAWWPSAGNIAVAWRRDTSPDSSVPGTLVAVVDEQHKTAPDDMAPGETAEPEPRPHPARMDLDSAACVGTSLETVAGLLDEELSDDEFGGDAFSGDLLQQMTRRVMPEGTEQVSGWVRADVAGRQRTTSVHLAFCPSFATTPEIEIEQLDGPEARIQIGQLLPHGVRLDLKLAQAAEEATEVVLEFSATARRE